MNAAAHLSRIAFDEYRALPALNISALKDLRHSPKVFKYRLENPKTSAAMTLGTAAHCATLEPERLSQPRFVAIPSRQSIWRRARRLAVLEQDNADYVARCYAAEARLAALELAAWDACEVAWRNLENPEDWNSREVKAAWDAVGELLPAKRPADSADEVQK